MAVQVDPKERLQHEEAFLLFLGREHNLGDNVKDIIAQINCLNQRLDIYNSALKYYNEYRA